MRQYSAFDQTIRVEYRAFPHLLWLGAGFEVRVGDRVFRPSGRLRIFGQPWTAFEIEHGGKRIQGLVRGVRPSWLRLHERYSFVVGHSELARETQLMRGWLLHCLAVFILWAACILMVLGACLTAFAVWMYLHPDHGS